MSEVQKERAGAVLPVLVGSMLAVTLETDVSVRVTLDGKELRPASAASEGQVRPTVLFVPCTPSIRDGEIRVVDTASGQDLAGSPFRLREPHASGSITKLAGRFVFGSVSGAGGREGGDLMVVAYSDLRAVAFATVQPSEKPGGDGSFALLLPIDVMEGPHQLVHLAIVGTGTALAGSPIRVGAQASPARRATPRARKPMRLAIKIATPNLRVAHEWGDYHFARALKKPLEKLGWTVEVDTQDRWYANRDADVVLVLRGRHRYEVDPKQTNLMWLISHPDRLVQGEPEDYDHVFVASDVYLPRFRAHHAVSSSTLHQATDADLFRPPEHTSKNGSVLFVGNSRLEFRTMVRWCLERKLPIALWGGKWEGLVPPEAIRGTHIANTDLSEVYGRCSILLNDHWDTMRGNGFLSNRLFDGSAAGAFIITDPVEGLAEVFGDTIAVAHDADDLAAQVREVLARPEASRLRADRARDIVLAHHTFDHRAQTIIKTVEDLAVYSRSPTLAEANSFES